MVYFNRQAVLDLEQIFEGLLVWEKHPLEIEHARKYRDDIIDVCRRLDTQSHHFNCKYPQHKLYGAKFTRYRRNKSTVWYIIYNISSLGDVFIEKILSNYETSEV